ncbi:MAG: 30S ribosomal protein S5 [Patescibacteria group bacterium]|nr:30S ribosomal protein S5 [Patescibacteria group bacterium]
MEEAKNKIQDKPKSAQGSAVNKTVYSKRRSDKKRARPKRYEKPKDEFDQKIVDIARVTRVMAGGKRMRFRACVAIGNKKGKIAVGIDKGSDVSIAVNKAVNKAKKKIVDISIVNDTIPHEVYYKYGAAKILFRPAGGGRGIISGGATRAILELSGIKNITTKNLGTNNPVNIAKCTVEALDSLKKVEVKKDNKNLEKIKKEKTSENKIEEKNTEKAKNK